MVNSARMIVETQRATMLDDATIGTTMAMAISGEQDADSGGPAAEWDVGKAACTAAGPECDQNAMGMATGGGQQ